MPFALNASISCCSFVKSAIISGLFSYFSSRIELASLPFLVLSQLFLLFSPLVLRDVSLFRGGGGGGGNRDALLFVPTSITTLWGFSRSDDPLAGIEVGSDMGRDEELAEELRFTNPRIEAGRRDGGGGGARVLSGRGEAPPVAVSVLYIPGVPWSRVSSITLDDSLSTSALVVLGSGTR